MMKIKCFYCVVMSFLTWSKDIRDVSSGMSLFANNLAYIFMSTFLSEIGQ